MKDDALEYLDTDTLRALVYVLVGLLHIRLLITRNRNKHSSYSSTFPIYIFTQQTEEVPDEDAVEPESEDKPSEASDTPETEKKDPEDSDEAIVEEEVEEKPKAEPAPPKMKTVVTDEWVRLNALPPLWMRSVHASRSQFTSFSCILQGSEERLRR